MAYKEVTTVGPVEWAKVYEHNRDMNGYEGSWVKNEGGYSILQVLSKEEMAKLMAAGSSKKAKQARLMDGEIVVGFQRLHKVFNKNGEEITKAGGAPIVVGPDNEPFTEIIGNGSIAEITNLVSTWQMPDGKTASRTTLQKIKILEHVPYEVADEDAA